MGEQTDMQLPLTGTGGGGEASPDLPFGPRDVKAGDAAASLGFGKRALNHWCTAGVGGDVCPSEMRRVGRVPTRFVNIDEVRAWRRRVGLDVDRVELFPTPDAKAPVLPPVVERASSAEESVSDAAEDDVAGEVVGESESAELEDLDAMLSMARDMMVQLREQVARLARQDSDKISPAAIEKAASATKKIGEELRALDKLDRERRDRLDLVVTRIEAGAAVRGVGQVLATGVGTLATDMPAVLRSRLTEAGAIEVRDQLVFDRITALELRERCDRVRARLGDELESAARSLESDGSLGTDEREAA